MMTHLGPARVTTAVIAWPGHATCAATARRPSAPGYVPILFVLVCGFCVSLYVRGCVCVGVRMIMTGHRGVQHFRASQQAGDAVELSGKPSKFLKPHITEFVCGTCAAVKETAMLRRLLSRAAKL